MIRKFNKLFVVPLVILFILFMSGCQKFDSFVEGEYVSTNEVDNEIISKVRLELNRINRITYSEANGVNVVCDSDKSGVERFFSFELYLYVDELGEYCRIDLTDFKHTNINHSPNYYCYPVDKDASYNISSIIFEFYVGPHGDNCFKFFIDQNDTTYMYELSLTNNIE